MQLLHKLKCGIYMGWAKATVVMLDSYQWSCRGTRIGNRNTVDLLNLSLVQQRHWPITACSLGTTDRRPQWPLEENFIHRHGLPMLPPSDISVAVYGHYERCDRSEPLRLTLTVNMICFSRPKGGIWNLPMNIIILNYKLQTNAKFT